MKKISLIILIIGVIFSSCQNGDWEFPDNDFSAVYFAYQTPVRTITLGKDYVNDNTIDNEHKCQIMATVAGFREIKKDIEISFKVDNTLCDGLDNVTAMPSNYYSLSDNKIIIKKGSKMMGGVVVTLTDAFFADTLALKKYSKGKVVNPKDQENYYVIPLVITDVKNADKILDGKEYILYAVKYLNPYDVIYLRRGTDMITEDGVTRTEKRQGNYSPEEDEVIKLNSISSKEIEFSVNDHRVNDINLKMTFKLDFDPITQKCTFANGAWKNPGLFKTLFDGDDKEIIPTWNWKNFQLVKEYVEEYYFDIKNKKSYEYRVYDIVVTGSGEYRTDGEKQSWGSKDRDALYLNYKVEYKVEVPIGSAPKTMKYETEDILVFRDRGIALETFEPVLKP